MRQLKKAYLEITNVCNLSCAFCPGTRREKGALPPEDFRLLAQRLRPHTEYLYLHLMGEPLLHPRLGNILDQAGELGFRVMITTNGTLLEERGALLLDSPAVEKVSVSLSPSRAAEAENRSGIWLGALPLPERPPPAESAVPCGFGTWTGRRPGERIP